ncbi:PTS sugar transporter subunit IIA [Leptotrichia sp. oral taxon 223]|uniref:BglG family transcription antiterminator n=1 Tax=Leptotrichia sp. oral taxon 223 TaxID=712363 RepID=UPI0015BFF595|nr:PTS sugar transporter subunit IIA [Leptotrichia sp. oral taxon 223]NWO19585.1 PTS sugar transporter subunit IIA [Leptotrichia sp. oral taxon 223]
MLNNREIKMLDIFSSGEEVSIKKLKEKFDISERMVRYDIEKINFVLSIFNIKPIYRNKSGIFKLDSDSKINKIKDIVKEAEPVTIEKRRNLIKFLLITTVKKLNISNLMEKFDTSRITINSDLNRIKKEFEEKEIKLSTKKGIILEGRISNLIKYRVEKISECLNYLKNTKNKTIYGIKIEEIFKENLGIEEVKTLSDFLKKILSKLNFSATDENYKTLLSYIILLQSENFHEEINNFICVDGGIIKEWDEYDTIKKEVKNYGLNEIFKEQDIFIITDLVVKISSYNKDSQFYENWIDLDILVKNLIENINSRLNVDISKDKLLFEYLRQHLNPFFYRVKNEYTLNDKFIQDLEFTKNNLFYLIKDSLNILTNILKKDIPDKEIFLLTLHFQASIERVMNNNIKVKRIIIISTLGYGISQILVDNISSLFNVEIVAVTPYFKLKETLLNNKNIDYIITTMDIEDKILYDIPILKVNPVFTIEDRKKMLDVGFVSNNKKVLISELIQIIEKEAKIHNKEKLIKKLENKMKGKIINDVVDEEEEKDIITDESIIFNYDGKNIEEAVEYTCNLLEKKGYISSSYTKSILDVLRNHTSYMIIHNGIILPHSKNKNNVFKTSGILLELKNNFELNGNTIKYIFTFAIKDKEKELNRVSKIINKIFKDELVEIMKTKNKDKIVKYFSKNTNA